MAVLYDLQHIAQLVALGREVNRIEQSRRGVKVHVSAGAGQQMEYTGTHVIVTLPVGVLKASLADHDDETAAVSRPLLPTSYQCMFLH